MRDRDPRRRADRRGRPGHAHGRRRRALRRDRERQRRRG